MEFQLKYKRKKTKNSSEVVLKLISFFSDSKFSFRVTEKWDQLPSFGKCPYYYFFFEKRGSRLNSTSCKNGSNALGTAEDHIAFTNIRHLLNSLQAHKKNCCLHSVAKLTFDYLQRLNFSGSKNRCRQLLKIFQRALGFKFIATRYLFTLTSSKAVWAASFSANWRSQNRQCDKN